MLYEFSLVDEDGVEIAQLPENVLVTIPTDAKYKDGKIFLFADGYDPWEIISGTYVEEETAFQFNSRSLNLSYGIALAEGIPDAAGGPGTESDTSRVILIIIIAAGAVLLIGGGVTAVLLIRKKRA